MPTELKIWTLNAEEGDSIVLEYINNDQKAYGVIDSNRLRSGEIPAAKKLNELGVTQLDFMLITHPHADHYSGIYDLIVEFDPIQIFSFPMGKHLSSPRGLDAQKKLFLEYTQNPDAYIQKAALEFIGILVEAKKRSSWEELVGPESRLRPPGFGNDVVFTVVSPFAREKGRYLQLVDESNPAAIYDTNLNNLSVALRIEFGGYAILLGADTTVSVWNDIAKRASTNKIDFASDFVKLSHHGSAKDSAPKVLDFLFGSRAVEGEMPAERVALISAIGNSHHPSDAVLEYLAENKIKPYCTNLSSKCRGGVRTMRRLDEFEPELERYLMLNDTNGAFTSKRPCQGDICLTISGNGDFNVTTQYAVPCPFRGDYDFLNAGSSPEV